MKLSTIFLARLTSAAETDETPISTLNNLRQISREMLISLWEANATSDTKYYEPVILPTSASVTKRWISKWDRKFSRNSVRMRRSFDRCGTTDDEANEEINVENDVENPCGVFNQLLNGFSIWTDRYISSCNGQKKKSHQKKRLTKWKYILNEGRCWKLKLFLLTGFKIFSKEYC